MPNPDVVDRAILSNAADHLHAVFRAPDRLANKNPAITLSNADPDRELSEDGGTSSVLFNGDCLDVWCGGWTAASGLCSPRRT